jgi:hypothetical protein
MARYWPAPVIQLVGAFAWLAVSAMPRPGAAQEPDPTATSYFTPPGSPGETLQPTDPGTGSNGEPYSPGDIIWESIFGKPDPNCWRPLPFSTFFSEGWDEPWVPSPNGSGGAPRQGWINAADGNMYRLWFFTFAQGFNHPPQSNAYLGSYTLLTPFSRRLMLITNVPFVVTNNTSDGLPTISPQGQVLTTTHSQTTFGDVSFTPRVLLHETKDFSLTADLTVLTPTGNTPLAGKTSLVPTIAFWRNIADGWVVRGGLGVNVPLDGSETDALISQLAIGQTLTPHDFPLLGDFTYYVSTVVDTPVSGGGQTSVALTPGIRTHLGHDWYFLAGLPIPLTKARVADLGMIFWFMKAW